MSDSHRDTLRMESQGVSFRWRMAMTRNAKGFWNHETTVEMTWQPGEMTLDDLEAGGENPANAVIPIAYLPEVNQDVMRSARQVLRDLNRVADEEGRREAARRREQDAVDRGESV